MCGLLAFVGSASAATRDAVSAALPCMHHRGPDETGVVLVDEAAVLAFQRLSIIDVAGSHQPLTYGPDGRYTLVYNGEIYNYLELRAELQAACGAEFATEGDTEVVAAAYHHWGPAGVSRLRGMFAFVLWDSVDGVAFAARDPFGIKPLYYTISSDGLWLASEKKALLSLVDDLALDRDALAAYITMQYVPEPGSLHRGVQRLPAGHTLRYTPGTAPVLARYWRPEFRPAPVARPDALYEQIRDALRESVRLHMRADVPVGAFLSSGVDSTAIVALAREVHPRLLTFTAALDVPGYSELAVAAASAASLGVANYPVAVDAAMMMDALPRIVWHLDDPVADPSLVPLYYVAQRAAQDVTVVLSGEGADELFAGYPLYREPLSLRPLTRLPPAARRGLRALARVIPEGVRGRSLLERGTMPIEERHDGGARLFRPAERARLLRCAAGNWSVAELYAEAAGLDDTTRMQYVDLHTWLTGDILLKADRMSMAHSLELRVPFLDTGVFAVAATVPTELKLPPGSVSTKVALRRALAGVVPPEIADRPKLGFPTPIRVWLRAEMYEWARDILARSGAGELLDLAYALKLLDAHRRGDGDQSRKIWTVLIFCLWHAIFVERAIAIAGIPRPGSPAALAPHPG